MKALFFIVVAIFAYAFAGAPLANEREVYWQADAPCDYAFEDALGGLGRLPGGVRLREDDLRNATYALPGGTELIVSQPGLRTHPVYGESFDAVWRDMTDRRPLQTRPLQIGGGRDQAGRAADDLTVLASVRNRLSVQYLTDDRNGVVSIRPDSITFRLTPRVRLAEWTGRSTASDRDAAFWDRKLCEHIHHELGHILVAVHALADAAPDFAAISGTDDKVAQGVQTFMDTLDATTAARQDLYHDWVAAFGLPVAHARPYLELPFPWLVEDGDWSAAPVRAP